MPLAPTQEMTAMNPQPLFSRRHFLATTAALAAPAVLRAADAPAKKLVMIAGSPSHGPLAHEFNAGVHLLKKCLAGTPGLETTAQFNGWPKDPQAFVSASAVFCFADGGARHPLIL